jgi:hypothetical protein
MGRPTLLRSARDRATFQRAQAAGAPRRGVDPRRMAFQLLLWLLVAVYPIAPAPSVGFARAGPGRSARAPPPAPASSVFAVFLTVRGCARIPAHRRFTNGSLRAHPAAAAMFEYAYVNYTGANDTDAGSLVPHPSWIEAVRARRADLGRKSLQMTAMDFFALAFFLGERAQPWFFRGTDDTMLNFRRLPSFIAELEARFDPATDPVVRGDCVVYNRSPVYLQGGAGFLASRAAAALMARGLDRFLAAWTTAEDTTFGPFLDAIGIGVYNCCSGAFMGHGPASMDVRAELDPAQYARTCPVRDMGRRPVPWHLAPLRDLLVYHKKDNPGRKLQVAVKRADMIFNAHQSLRWYSYDNFWPRACTIKSKT